MTTHTPNDGTPNNGTPNNSQSNAGTANEGTVNSHLPAPDSRYKAAGVDIEAGNRAVAQMKPAIRSTYTADVLADVGSFGGLFALSKLPGAPVLVASIDGVGTKVKLAAQAARLFPAPQDEAGNQVNFWRNIGHDLVNHCINDILVQNARPLFFLDYVAAARLEPETVAQVVTGMAEACRAGGCALLGGETAEMPGVYAEGALDVAGAIVGLVDREQLLPRQATMRAGDVLLGLPSSGPHTNGYSLIRKALNDELDAQPAPTADRDTRMRAQLSRGLPDGPDAATRLIDALLAPHRSYLPEIDALAQAELLPKGMAHITGGGFFDNVPRILPPHLAAQVDSHAWTPGPLFELLAEMAELEKAEAYRVFNMGIGMVLVIDAESAEAVQATIPHARIIGELVDTQPDTSPFILR